MQIAPRSYVSALALLVLLMPGQASAQAGEACGTAGTLLMHCTFDRGAKQVGVCLTDDIVSYQFGPDLSVPELLLSSSFADLDYVPYGWASNTIHEGVMFRNGNTTYEVYASIPRGPDAGAAEGGILVTSPDGSRTDLSCDQGSVYPNDPLEGIGKLEDLISGNGYLLLQTCLDGTDNPQTCVGRVRALEVKLNRCIIGADQTGCWTTEAAAWDILVRNYASYGQAILADLQGDAFAEQLRAGQDSWNTTRTFDCDLLLTLPFAGDGGAAKCSAAYTAERLRFLQEVVRMAEFDG